MSLERVIISIAVLHILFFLCFYIIQTTWWHHLRYSSKWCVSRRTCHLNLGTHCRKSIFRLWSVRHWWIGRSSFMTPRMWLKAARYWKYKPPTRKGHKTTFNVSGQYWVSVSAPLAPLPIPGTESACIMELELEFGIGVGPTAVEGDRPWSLKKRTWQWTISIYRRFAPRFGETPQQVHIALRPRVIPATGDV